MRRGARSTPAPQGVSQRRPSAAAASYAPLAPRAFATRPRREPPCKCAKRVSFGLSLRGGNCEIKTVISANKEKVEVTAAAKKPPAKKEAVKKKAPKKKKAASREHL